MKRILSLLLIVAAVFQAGCSNQGEVEKLRIDLEESRGTILELEKKLQSYEESQSQAGTSVLALALDVMDSIKNRDMNALSAYVDPVKGVRFTPYFYIDAQNDQNFSAQQISGVLQDGQIYNWGSYDGSGEPIDLTFADYYDAFVYDLDFLNAPMLGNNYPIGTGNIVDNLSDVYTNGYFVEFHFPEIDAQYEGMDWESLRLVFEETNNVWYLVGVIHGQWTI